MKRPAWPLIFILFAGLCAFTGDDLPLQFKSKLDRAQMTFNSPAGYTEMPLVTNSQMRYDYAVKLDAKDFEIRYAIRPLDSVFIQFAAMKKQGGVVINPNKLYSGLFMATVMNLSGGKLFKINVFDTTAVKKEFNADWGATCIFPIVGEFGKGYNTCMAIALHKNNLGDAYIFYLSNAANNYQNELLPVFYALKFK
jgi:hypothetical protein